MFQAGAGRPQAGHLWVLEDGVADCPGHPCPPSVKVALLKVVHEVLCGPRPSLIEEPPELFNNTWALRQLSHTASGSGGPADLPGLDQGLDPPNTTTTVLP